MQRCFLSSALTNHNLYSNQITTLKGLDTGVAKVYTVYTIRVERTEGRAHDAKKYTCVHISCGLMYCRPVKTLRQFYSSTYGDNFSSWRSAANSTARRSAPFFALAFGG